ncbi:MAG TPA: hypothetical protein VNH53_03845 [Sphingomicrobium sp.]|nr:hypothetical protein [Sphingomicrobium sp.]
MAIDMKALERAAAGNPDDKVAVRKEWLGEVHRRLTTGARAEAELAQIRREHQIFDAIFGQPAQPTRH